MFTEIRGTDDTDQMIMSHFTERLLQSDALMESKVLQQLKKIGSATIQKIMGPQCVRLVERIGWW